MIYLPTISITINFRFMFYGKKINALEERLDALEVRVHELAHLASKYCQDVDALAELYRQQEAAKAQRAQQRKKFKPKNNGKENSAATE